LHGAKLFAIARQFMNLYIKENSVKFLRFHLTIALALVVGMAQCSYGFADKKSRRHDTKSSGSHSSSNSSCASEKQVRRAKRQLLDCCKETQCLVKDVDQDLDTCCEIIQNGINEILQELESDEACGEVIAIGQSDIPYIIAISGQEYCLAEDVTSSFDSAITVASGVKDIVLDMNLHTINLTSDVGNAISVESDTSNVTIKNGRISGNTVVVPPVHPGIPAYPSGPSVLYGPGQNGILVDTSELVTISDIKVDTVNIGLILFTSNAATVTGCFFKDSVWGMAVSSLDSNAAFFVPTNNLNIEDCEMSNMAEFGIYFVVGDYDDVTLRNLIVENNQSDGLFWDQDGGGNNWLIENVRCANNQGNGVHTQFYANNIIFNNCQFLNNLRNGIGVIGTRNCIMNDCQAVGNGLSGIAFLTRASDNVQLNNCQVVNDSTIGNGGEIPLRFEMVRNLLIDNCQVYSWSLPTIPDCDPEICSLDNFPAVRILECYNVKMIDSLITLSFTDPQNPGNGLVIRSSEGIEIENVISDFGFLGGLDPTEIQANCFLVQGGVSNCRFKDCVATGSPNNGFAVVWDHEDDGDEGESSSISESDAIYDSFSGSITFENCKAVGARNAGFYINLPSEDDINLGGAVLLGNEATHNFIGIELENGTINCQIRDNTMLSNTTYGLLDNNSSNPDTQNAIYHNFASDNGTANFSPNVQFVVPPGPGIGSIENISG
jgi:parallel beta-helix repeat protein